MPKYLIPVYVSYARATVDSVECYLPCIVVAKDPHFIPPSLHTLSSWRGSQQDTHETAAFILSVIARSQLAGLQWSSREATSYWDVSDVFEEGGFAFANNSFNGNFGLVNVHGVPKPAYRAFQLLHELGDEILPVKVALDGSN